MALLCYIIHDVQQEITILGQLNMLFNVQEKVFEWSTTYSKNSQLEKLSWFLQLFTQPQIFPY